MLTRIMEFQRRCGFAGASVGVGDLAEGSEQCINLFRGESTAGLVGERVGPELRPLSSSS